MNRSPAVLVSSVAIALCISCSAPSDSSDSAPPATGAAAGMLAESKIAEIRSTIDAANTKWLAAMVAGDVVGAIGNYADNAVVMMPMMPAWHGRTAIEAGMKEMMSAMKVNDAKTGTVDVMAGGDLAIETGRFTMTTTMKGATPATDTGKYLAVWQRQADGSWKIIRDISAPGPPTLRRSRRNGAVNAAVTAWLPTLSRCAARTRGQRSPVP
jgi:uncharacterized protein (TIGR02246 family)